MPSSRRDHRTLTLKPHQFAHIGIAKSFQITNLFPNFSALENVRIALQAHVSRYGLWRRRADLADLVEEAMGVCASSGSASEATRTFEPS
ncbi:hypothetical protein CDO46_10975 [Pigmentiphaga sp. NML030171]|uniref:Uncharacterized protein n=1 Tax=Pigmentiphaga daeguensis TaxID=414049 RepID=A0ABN1D747_9BURK|nr:hypothetical protein [Pigmentiphaga sp. NML030171]OVZ63739.1 hypothetical protein CDO46_10975 [Pigmentiphaga sp. NML030171]